MKSCFSEAENNRLQFDRRKAIQELVRGQEMAVLLQNRIGKPQETNNYNGQAANQDLVLKILDSFNNSISMLKNDDGDFSDEAVSQIVAETPSYFSSPQDSGESSKASAIKDRRGCYKRRKSSGSWSTDTTNLVDDGHAWRKYGQKKILRADYPRSYYRCTHKYDQGCNATKQVQQISENPPLYRTTYNGQHTCQDVLRSTQMMIIDSADISQDATMISFDNSKANPFFSSLIPSAKEERHQSIKPDRDDDDGMLHGGGDYHQQQQPPPPSSSSSEFLMMSPVLTTALEESSPEELRCTDGLMGYAADFDDYVYLKSQLEEYYGSS